MEWEGNFSGNNAFFSCSPFPVVVKSLELDGKYWRQLLDA